MKSKSTLLITSTLLSQVLHPTNVLAYQAPSNDTLPAKGKIADQLRNYFAKEVIEADEAFRTSQYYVDSVTEKDGSVVPHVFQLSVVVKKLKVPKIITPSEESCSTGCPGGNSGSRSSSTSGPTPDPQAPQTFEYQFVFIREDLTASLLGVWGDQRTCSPYPVGHDAEGNTVVTEICNSSNVDTYLGNLVGGDSQSEVFAISNTSSNTVDPFTLLTVTTSANGAKTAKFSTSKDFPTNPVGTVQSDILLIDAKK